MLAVMIEISGQRQFDQYLTNEAMDLRRLVVTAIELSVDHARINQYTVGKYRLMEIKIDRQPTKDKLDQLGVFNWSIWTKEASEFPWSYGESETCYFLEGDVVVTPDRGEPDGGECPVQMGKGDLVTFPRACLVPGKLSRM
jgi:uncharacterized cupin superfamily protein